MLNTCLTFGAFVCLLQGEAVVVFEEDDVFQIWTPWSSSKSYPTQPRGDSGDRSYRSDAPCVKSDTYAEDTVALAWPPQGPLNGEKIDTYASTFLKYLDDDEAKNTRSILVADLLKTRALSRKGRNNKMSLATMFEEFCWKWQKCSENDNFNSIVKGDEFRLHNEVCDPDLKEADNAVNAWLESLPAFWQRQELAMAEAQARHDERAAMAEAIGIETPLNGELSCQHTGALANFDTLLTDKEGECFDLLSFMHGATKSQGRELTTCSASVSGWDAETNADYPGTRRAKRCEQFLVDARQKEINKLRKASSIRRRDAWTETVELIRCWASGQAGAPGSEAKTAPRSWKSLGTLRRVLMHCDLREINPAGLLVSATVLKTVAASNKIKSVNAIMAGFSAVTTTREQIETSDFVPSTSTMATLATDLGYLANKLPFPVPIAHGPDLLVQWFKFLTAGMSSRKSLKEMDARADEYADASELEAIRGQTKQGAILGFTEFLLEMFTILAGPKAWDDIWAVGSAQMQLGNVGKSVGSMLLAGLKPLNPWAAIQSAATMVLTVLKLFIDGDIKFDANELFGHMWTCLKAVGKALLLKVVEVGITALIAPMMGPACIFAPFVAVYLTQAVGVAYDLILSAVEYAFHLVDTALTMMWNAACNIAYRSWNAAVRAGKATKTSLHDTFEDFYYGPEDAWQNGKIFSSSERAEIREETELFRDLYGRYLKKIVPRVSKLFK